LAALFVAGKAMMPLGPIKAMRWRMLSSAGRDGAAQALLSAHGLDASMMTVW